MQSIGDDHLEKLRFWWDLRAIVASANNLFTDMRWFLLLIFFRSAERQWWKAEIVVRFLFLFSVVSEKIIRFVHIYRHKLCKFCDT